MTEIESTPPQPVESRSFFSRYVPVLLALVALAVFIGVVFYAYQQGEVSGTSGAVPEVVAEGDQGKTRPENPGGMDVPHQDKFVLNDRGTGGVIEDILAKSEDEKAAPADEQGMASMDEEPSQQQPVPAAMADEPAPAVMETPAVEESTGAVAVESPSVAAVDEPAPAPAPAAAIEETPAIAPASSSGYQAQLLASKNEAAVTKAKDSLMKKHGPLFDGVSLVVEKADLGAKGVFYRLNAAGLASKDAASAFCVQYQKASGKKDCIVKKVKG